MTTTEHPTLDVQEKYWDDKWSWSRTQYPHDRALRRGDKILTYVRTLGIDKPRILDFGCGTGWFTNKLAQLGPTTGIDLSPEAIDQARVQFPSVTFFAGDLFEIPIPEMHFDIVVSQEVIAHVADQHGYVERMARALKPGGHAVVTTPNPFVHDRVPWPPQPPGHIEQWLTPKALKQLLHPLFRVLRKTTAVPLGDRGILRVVNSTRLNRALGSFWGTQRVEDFKEWAGFGWTQIVLAKKIS